MQKGRPTKMTEDKAPIYHIYNTICSSIKTNRDKASRYQTEIELYETSDKEVQDLRNLIYALDIEYSVLTKIKADIDDPKYYDKEILYGDH